jgi:hypothetical protein
MTIETSALGVGVFLAFALAAPLASAAGEETVDDTNEAEAAPESEGAAEADEAPGAEVAPEAEVEAEEAPEVENPPAEARATVSGTATASAPAPAAEAATVEARDADDRAEMAVWRVTSASEAALTPDELSFLRAYERYQATQRIGLGLFGAGFGLALVGVVLTLIDPYEPLGLAGFIVVGSGVAIQSSGMFVLGLSRSAWQEQLRGEFEPLLNSARGGTVGYRFIF